jgi:hypothetical protein
MYILKHYEPHNTGKLYLINNGIVYDALVMDKQQIELCLANKLKNYNINKCTSPDSEFKAARTYVQYYVIKYEFAITLLPDNSKWQAQAIL